jgi:hypothetical protein
MEYLAGIFDAEGCISLNSNGSFPISLEIANEEIPIIFRETFNGSIYTRKREDRKKTWIWKINSINDHAIFFLKSIVYSVVKAQQRELLLWYLSMNRKERREERPFFCEQIRKSKIPQSVEQWSGLTNEPMEKTDEKFFKWFAGFIDGDGNFVCNQYIDKRNQRKYFGHQMSFANTDGYLIVWLNSIIQGTVTKCPRSRNLLYKWTPKRKYERWILESILPFLKIKKNQCQLILEYIDCPNEVRKLEIINQIKHLNSL